MTKKGYTEFMHHRNYERNLRHQNRVVSFM